VQNAIGGDNVSWPSSGCFSDFVPVSSAIRNSSDRYWGKGRGPIVLAWEAWNFRYAFVLS